MPPVLGVVAVAAYAAKRVQSGASWRTQSSRASEPSTASAVAGTAIRACPYRSTSRAVHGATSAVAARPVAVTAPARAYEPRGPAIMMTALTLNMPMGSRARRLPAVKARAPGGAKSRRYGLRRAGGGCRRARVAAPAGRPEAASRAVAARCRSSDAAWRHPRRGAGSRSNTCSAPFTHPRCKFGRVPPPTSTPACCAPSSPSPRSCTSPVPPPGCMSPSRPSAGTSGGWSGSWAPSCSYGPPGR